MMHFSPKTMTVKIAESPSENPRTTGAQVSALPIPENVDNR